MNSRMVLVLMVAIAALVVLIVLTRPRSPTPEDLVVVINRYVDKQYFVDFSKNETPSASLSMVPIDDLEQAYYSNCIELLKQYGQTVDGVNINQHVAERSINLYFLGKDPEKAFETFRNNCTYVGHHNIIIFDSTYLLNELFHKELFLKPGQHAAEETKLQEFGLSGEDLTRVLYDHIRTLIMWVVGHEIGHIAHHHQKRHYRFAGEPPSILIRYDSSASQKEEKEADEFAVQAIGDWKLGHFMWLGMSQLIANPTLYGAQRGPNVQLIVPKTYNTHPPLYVRFLDLSISAIQAKLFMDTTGYFEGVRQRIVVEEKR